jgi:hypothetical protein
MNTELESILRRIGKLLAIASDERADANEASAAASMAGCKWAIQSIGELMAMWSKPHPSKVSIESILTESQR